MGVVPTTPAGAVTPNYFYPNTTTDQLDPGSSCLYQSTGPCSLRDAIALAGNYTGGDAYVVPASAATYTLTLSNYLPVSGTVVSPAHTVTIEGNNAVIDDSGNGGEPTMAGGGGSGPAYNLEVDDLTLTGTTGSSSLEWEGKGNLTLSDVTFSDNHTSSGGPAGLFVGAVGTLTMNNVTFTGNHGASDQGEAGAEINGVQNSATLTGVDFDHNRGEALTTMFESGPISLNHVLFEDNTGSEYPTLELNVGTAGGSLENVDVEGNVTTWQDANDATVALYGSFSTLDDVTIANNVVGASGGGAMLSLIGTATATNWTISGNQVQASSGTVPIAGGIDVEAGPCASTTLQLPTIPQGATPMTCTPGALLPARARSSCSTRLSPAHRRRAPSRAQPMVDRSPAPATTSTKGNPAVLVLQATSTTSTRALGHLSAIPGTPVSARCFTAAPPSMPPARTIARQPTPSVPPGRRAWRATSALFESTLTHLAVTVEPSATSLPSGGGDVTYRLGVSNLSGVAPQDVQVTDQLPAGAKLTSATSSSGTCLTSPSISCSLGLVRRGADADGDPRCAPEPARKGHRHRPRAKRAAR